MKKSDFFIAIDKTFYVAALEKVKNMQTKEGQWRESVVL